MRKEIATNGVKAVTVLNAWVINWKTKKKRAIANTSYVCRKA